MRATINILQNKFGSSKNLPTFVMPNHVKISESERYISNRLNKAGFLSDNSSSEVLRGLATLRGGSPLFVRPKDILITFFKKMPNHEKVSKATNIVSKSATCSSTKTSQTLYQITMDLVVSYNEPDGRVRRCGVIHTDIYQADNENEALGLALSVVRAKYSSWHDIDLKSIKRTQTYNI